VERVRWDTTLWPPLASLHDDSAKPVGVIGLDSGNVRHILQFKVKTLQKKNLKVAAVKVQLSPHPLIGDFLKVQRSTSTRSSPSPPPATPIQINGNITMTRSRRRRSTTQGSQRPTIVDWSTSYMASASSSHSHGTVGVTGEDSSTFDDSADDDSVHGRDVHVDHQPTSFRLTRSLSPAISRTTEHPGVCPAHATPHHPTHTRSPSSMRHSSHNHHRIIVNLLPKYYILNPSIPRLSAQIDTRKLLEHLLLFSAIILAIVQFSRFPHVIDELWVVRGTFPLILTEQN
jgi:hypothetical protein